MFIDRPVGIDLGTTNSEIAILDPSERDLHLYEDRFGRKTVPSALAWDPKKECFLVGRPARNRRGKTPPPVESIKRRMGRSVKVEVGPHSLSPEEVSAKILEELRTKMQGHLQAGAPVGSEVRVDRAVITVPAYFDAPQMEATHRAGSLAGLDVLAVLQEPTAAAIYHAWQHQLSDGNYLIYDLGGGTFDVSILRCLAGEYQVLAIDGDNFLGGDDFDRRYAEVLRKQLIETGYRLDLDVAGDAEDAERFQRLVHVAQEIKEMLSTKEVVAISKSDFAEDQDGELMSLDLEVGREDYANHVSDLVATTIACCQRALEESQKTASVGVAELDHVILVGGSTRVPSVIEAVRVTLCAESKSKEPLQDEVDTCVALGAAIHAAQLGGLRLGSPGAPGVLLPSPLVSSREELSLDFVLEPPDAGTGVRLRVGDTWIDATSSEGKGRIAVPMPTEGDHPVTMELTQGDTTATYDFVVCRGDVRQRASNLSQPSVVAKDVALDVMRAGRRTSKVLVPKGQGLPVDAKHRFFTADQSGAVVLRVLQDRLPIKTLVVEVPKELEVGTPVDLTLSIDEAMRIEAKAEVGGQELWARIESAELDTPRSAAEVEALLAEGEAIGAGLWGHEAESFRYHFDTLKSGLRETLGTDPDKAAHLAGRLRRLLDNFRVQGEALQPPMFRFEHTLNSLRRDAFSSGGEMLGQSIDEWEVRINNLAQRGEDAWNAGDARTWRRVYNEAQALAETASEKQWAERSSSTQTDWAARLATRRRTSERLRQGLVELVLSSSPEVRMLQEAEQNRLLVALDQVDASLSVSEDISRADLRKVVEQSEGELARIRASFERIPELGIVADRG
ncbi:MAG: Hsp70 family protein [Polyangiales bacterium]